MPLVYSNTRLKDAFQVCIIFSFFVAAPCSAVVELEFGYLVATEFRNQEGSNAPNLDSHRPYRVLSHLQFTGGSILGGFLRAISSPTRDWRYARIENNGMWIGADFNKLESMTNAFPTGTYEWSVSSTNGQALSGTLDLAPISFPTAPRIVPGNKTVWIGSRLVLTDPDESASITWQEAPIGVYEIFISVNGVNTTLDASATGFIFTPDFIAELPLEEPVECLIQFNSNLGHTATSVWLWVPRPQENDYFAVARGRTYVQTDNINPRFWIPQDAALFDSDFGPFYFNMLAAKPGQVAAPGGRMFSLFFANPDLASHCSGPYTTQSALDAAYPDGIYKFGNKQVRVSNLPFPNRGIPIKVLSVNGKPPRWRDGKLLLDVKRDNTLLWTPFQIVRGLPFSRNCIISLNFGYISSFSWQITDQLEAGFTKVSRNPFNRFTIRKNTLFTDRDYLLSIRYFLASFLDDSNFSTSGGETTTFLHISPES